RRRRNSSRTGTRTNGGSRPGPTNSAPRGTPAGRRPCSAPSTGSRSTDQQYYGIGRNSTVAVVALSPQARADAIDAMADGRELDVLVIGGGGGGTGAAPHAATPGPA